MAYRLIRIEGDPILRKKARPVKSLTPHIKNLLDDMMNTMHANNGVGLAGPQVGVLRRVIVVDVGQGEYRMVNPEIVEASEEQQLDIEGCLSIPNFNGTVYRPQRVKVRYQDERGDDQLVEAEGLFARCLCHEIDHLDGILFRDKVDRAVDLDHPTAEQLAYLKEKKLLGGEREEEEEADQPLEEAGEKADSGKGAVKKVVFMGSPAFALPSLKALHESSDFSVELVISQADKKRNRNRLEPTAVKSYALENGLEVITPEKLNQAEVWDKLKAIAPDFLVVVAYGKIIGKTILSACQDRVINVHGSLLPKYRGASPVQTAMLEGEKVSGITIMLLDQGMDTGDILSQASLPIEEGDDLSSYSDRLAELGAVELMKTLRRFDEAYAERRKQDDSQASLTRKIQKEDGYLNFREPAQKLVNQVRVLKDWPGARFAYQGVSYKVHRAHKEEGEGEEAGRLVRVDPEGLAVQTGDGLFVIDSLQAPGKRVMTARDFLNGHSFRQGDFLEALE